MFPFDSKSHRKKGQWGGARAGSGPKRKKAPIVTYSVRLTHDEAEMLKLWGGGDVSAGLRWLISCAAPLVDVAIVTIDMKAIDQS